MSLRKQKLDKKKEEMIQSAAEVFAEKGYNGTTMEDIAAKLLMTKGSVYYYFKDKQDLLFQMQQTLLNKSISYIQDILQQDLSTERKMKQALKTHITFILKDRASFELMIKPELYFTEEQQSVLQKQMDMYSDCFDQLIKEGVERQLFYPVEIKITRNILLGAVNHVLHWYSPSGQKSISEIADLISEYLLRMLLLHSK